MLNGRNSTFNRAWAKVAPSKKPCRTILYPQMKTAGLCRTLRCFVRTDKMELTAHASAQYNQSSDQLPRTSESGCNRQHRTHRTREPYPLPSARRHPSSRVPYGDAPALPPSALGLHWSQRILRPLWVPNHRHPLRHPRSAPSRKVLLCSPHAPHLSALLRRVPATPPNDSDLPLALEPTLDCVAAVRRELPETVRPRPQ